jgi:hypothetical protein
MRGGKGGEGQERWGGGVRQGKREVRRGKREGRKE